MAKIIRYKFLSAEIDHGTEESPDIEQILLDKTVPCPTEASFDANYAVAVAEAVGEITVEGEYDPGQPTPAGDDSAVWDELDAAYQEGVDSV